MRNMLRRLPSFFRLSRLVPLLRRKVDVLSSDGAFCVVGPSGQGCAWEKARMLSAAVRQSCDLVMITDPRGHIEYVNPAFEDVAGYTLEEVLGRHAGFMTLTASGQRVFHRLHDVSTPGDGSQGRFLYRRKDGSTFHLLQTVSAVQGSEGKAERYIVIGREVTEQVRSEQQTDRLTAVGQLAAGVAHDFNNILTVIIGSLQLAAEDVGPNAETVSEALSTAQSAADRGKALVQQLSTFGRLRPSSPQVLEMAQQVLGFKDFAARLLPTTIDLHVELSPGDAWVRLDPTQLDQVLLNLVVNARDAMPEGGTLIIELRRVEVKGREKESGEGISADGWVHLSVRDSGAGMDKGTLERIFEPFFTTKPLGKGTGLGLSTVYGIVAEAEGRIDVRSAPGRGTCFHIWFPEVEAPGATSPFAGRRDR